MQDEQRELAKTIRVSGSILLSTVSNFLDFFKMEAGKALDIVRTEVDVQVRTHTHFDTASHVNIILLSESRTIFQSRTTLLNTIVLPRPVPSAPCPQPPAPCPSWSLGTCVRG